MNFREIGINLIGILALMNVNHGVFRTMIGVDQVIMLVISCNMQDSNVACHE